MAARKAIPSKEQQERTRAAKFYIYCFREGEAVLYVGKGTGGRLKMQEKRFSLPGEILERLDCEDLAYQRERHWISMLMPSENKNAGGGGGFSDPNPIPKDLRGQISLAEWSRHASAHKKEIDEIERVGSRKYAAALILRFVNDNNCERLGISPVKLEKIRAVAIG